jgi:drug/metabolite transporter (DMT)-like permease
MIWPIVLVFLSIPLLGHKIAIKSFLALFISFAGVYFISSQGKPFSFHFQEPFGILLATGSSVIWSFYWIFNVRDKRDEVLKLLLNFFFATVYISILAPFFTTISFNQTKGLLLAGYAGLFEMGFSFLFWLMALKFSKTSDRISNLVYLAPFVSLILIHIFVGEMIYRTTIIGLCLIIAGIIIEKIR